MNIKEIKENINIRMEIKYKQDSLEEYRKRFKDCYRRSPAILTNAQKDLIWEESKESVGNRLIFKIWDKIYR